METTKVLKPRTESQNFLASLLAIIFTVIGAQGVLVPEDAPSRLIEAFQSMDSIMIIMAITPLVIVPGLKVYQSIKENGWNTNFLRSTNFLFQVVSVILLALEMFGIIPEDSGKVSVTGLQSLNIGIHVKRDLAV